MNTNYTAAEEMIIAKLLKDRDFLNNSQFDVKEKHKACIEYFTNLSARYGFSMNAQFLFFCLVYHMLVKDIISPFYLSDSEFLLKNGMAVDRFRQARRELADSGMIQYISSCSVLEVKTLYKVRGLGL